MIDRIVFLIVIIGVGSLATPYLNAQTLNRYGMFTKTILANQIWETKTTPTGKISWQGPGEKVPNLTFGVGVFAELMQNEQIKVVPRLSYIQKGFSETVVYLQAGEVAGEGTLKQKLHYLSLDVLAKALTSGKRFRSYIGAGIRTDFLLGYNANNFDNPPSYRDYSALLHDFNKVAVGGVLTVGFEVNEKFLFELEYNRDLLPAFENDHLIISNQVIAMNIGWIFGNGTKKDA